MMQTTNATGKDAPEYVLQEVKKIIDRDALRKRMCDPNKFLQNETSYILKLLTGKELSIENNKPKNSK